MSLNFTEDQLKALAPGDRVVVSARGVPYGARVVRVTPTTLVVRRGGSEERFNRTTGRACGRDYSVYGRPSLEPVTPASTEMIRRRWLLGNIEAVNRTRLHTMETADLERIYSIYYPAAPVDPAGADGPERAEG